MKVVMLEGTTRHVEISSTADVSVSIKRQAETCCIIFGTPQEMIAFALDILNVAATLPRNPEE